ncbi:MAG: hypothetical protein V3V86_00230 [Gammaproteobacteria bacterium]
MEAFLNFILRWPIVESYFSAFSWAWPLNEIVHFAGIILLVGIVGVYDLRLLGVAREIPVAALSRLLPWAVFGFVITTITGLMFTTGIYANIRIEPGTVLVNDGYLQLKLVFYFLAGINLFAFYRTGVARAVDNLGPGDDAPPIAKAFAGASLFCWIAVMYWGRLLVWGQLS